MKTLVVYNSYFGNTEKVAQAVCETLKSRGEAECRKVSEVDPGQLQGYDLLVVGSPTRAFQPSDGTKKFLKNIPTDALQGMDVAAFDTRINPEETNSGFLRFMVRMFGYADAPIARQLTKKGGRLSGKTEGFFVSASEGPLKDGELERAQDWARSLGQA